MRALQSAFVVGLILCLTSCTPDPSRYVTKQKYDELQDKLTFVQAKLDEAEKQLADYEAHRYTLFNSGFRTFRMDSVTGEACIKLTSASDWKRADVKQQSCDCRDYITDFKAEHNAELNKLFCGP